VPTYEYACRVCGEHLEVVQSFTDEPLTVCPACGGELRKVFGNIGIVFKGSGFYKTDSRGSSGSAGSASSTSSSSSASSEGGSSSSGGSSSAGVA
jgi:putative FmdB family regulatory protein